MRTLTLTFAEHRTGFEPGERLRGEARWQLEAPPKSVELHLLWYTEGKGDQDVEVVASLPLGSSAAGSAPFDLRLPMGPWSVSGTLLSILWAVELVVEPAEGDAEVVRELIAVAPGGREVQLAALDGGAGDGAARA